MPEKREVSVHVSDVYSLSLGIYTGNSKGRLLNAASINVMLLPALISLKEDKPTGNSPSPPDYHSCVISVNSPLSSNSFGHTFPKSITPFA